MRRSFNKALCISTPPPPPPRPKKIPPPPVKRAKTKRKRILKTAQKRCTGLEILMDDYIDQMGVHWNVKELAYRCGVSETSARKWTYGYCPGKYVWWHIARYFAQHLPVTADIIHADIKATIEDWRAR
jgi:hypothetical protein